jgi:GntR family transcriptional repressor for pyruvate dehydrogenase complex
VPRRNHDATSTLIQQIVSGVRGAGTMLPREVDLAAEFDVSRGVARECVRALEERGLVSVKHGMGATVNPPEDWDVLDADVLAATLETEASAAVLAQYVECRRILEVEAAALAAERASAEDLLDASKALRQMERSVKAGSSPAAEALLHEADVAFHQALCAATGNRPLGRLVERIHAALLVARYPLARPQYREERALPEHRRILAAVMAGDADEARRAMSAHFDTIVGYLREYAGDELTIAPD